MPLKGDIILHKRLKVLTVLPHVVHHQMAMFMVGGGGAIQLVTQCTEQTIPAEKDINDVHLFIREKTKTGKTDTEI